MKNVQVGPTLGELVILLQGIIHEKEKQVSKTSTLSLHLTYISALGQLVCISDNKYRTQYEGRLTQVIQYEVGSAKHVESPETGYCYAAAAYRRIHVTRLWIMPTSEPQERNAT